MAQVEVGEMEAQLCTPAVLKEPEELCFPAPLLKGALARQCF